MKTPLKLTLLSIVSLSITQSVYALTPCINPMIAGYEEDIHCPFSDVAAVKRNGKYGFINPQGKTVIDFQYDEVGQVGEYIPVKKQDKWGYIDKTGKVIMPLKYDDISRFTENLYIVKNNGKYGIIDNNEKIVVNYQYDNIFRLYPNIAVVINNGKYGLIDHAGKIILPIEYDSIYPERQYYYQGVTTDNIGEVYLVNTEVKKGDEVFYINTQGQRIQ